LCSRQEKDCRETMAGVLFRSFAIVGPQVREGICNNFCHVSLFMEDVSTLFLFVMIAWLALICKECMTLQLGLDSLFLVVGECKVS
jgi:hypothetical protein